MPTWWKKLQSIRRRSGMEADLHEEMRTHLEMKAEYTGRGRDARQQFGNPTLLVEDSVAEWGWPQLESWVRDFRFAVRSALRQPAFTLTVVLTLALGIGASGTIYALIDTVLIRPLPFPDADRLAGLYDARQVRAGSEGRTRISPGRLEDLQQLNKSFESLAGWYLDVLTDTSGPLPERVSGAYVSPRFFSVLGTGAARGRTFTSVEEQFGGPQSIVISDGLWRRRFSADPDVLGRTLMLSGQSFAIVGIMPASFRYPEPATDVWLPKQARPGLLQIREARFYATIGRLKPGVTIEQSRADMAAVQQILGGRYPKTDAGFVVTMEPLKDQLVGKVQSSLWLLFVSVTILLLIACANVGCLMLARLNSRSEEIATRTSLGAGNSAIARQLFVEGLVCSIAGGVLGVFATHSGILALQKLAPNVPRIEELALDGRVLLALAAITLFSALLFSLAPILQLLRRDIGSTLIRRGRGVAGGGQRLQKALVAGQLALATSLLIGAGLFLRTMMNLQVSPLGYQPEGVLTLHVGSSFNEPPDAAVQRHKRTIEALSGLPGVTSVAMSAGLPGVNPSWPREFLIEGEPNPEGTVPFANWRVVTGDYFRTLSIPVLEGRTCEMSTEPKRPFEALVNRTFAERHFQGRSPLDRIVHRGPQGEIGTRIVGVVGDVKEDGHGSAPPPVIYACGYLRFWPDADILVRTSNVGALASGVRRELQALEPSRPVYGIRPLSEALYGALAQARFRTLLISLFSFLALALSAIGLYGVMAYMVSQRTREIGVRVALGARPSQIVTDVLRSGGVLAIAGTVAGVLLAVAASRLMRTQLYGVGPSDLATYLSAIVVLIVVALLACLIPGRRATSIDPIEALREQ